MAEVPTPPPNALTQRWNRAYYASFISPQAACVSGAGMMADPRGAEIAKHEALFSENPDGRVFTHLAEAYRRAGDPERARVLLETGLARHADYASAHVVHGRVLRDLGLGAEAEAAFRPVLGVGLGGVAAVTAR